MPLVNSITHNGISWNFTHSVSSGNYVTGDPWVLGSVGGGVEISSITPTVVLGPSSTNIPGSTNWSTQWHDRNGSMLNPHWTAMRFQGVAEPQGAAGPDGKSPAYGFHGSATPHTDSSKLYLRDANWSIIRLPNNTYVPISNTNRKVLPVNNSLVSCNSTVPGNVVPPGTRTSIRKQAILTCVSSVPADGSFRPAFALLDKTSFVLSSNINYNILADIPASAVNSLAPSNTYFNAIVSALRYPNLMYGSQGGSYFIGALENNLCDGYGQSMATIQNAAIAYMNTDRISFENKKTILNYIIQRAIDLEGSVRKTFEVSSTLGLPDFKFGGGGQMNSLKAPLVVLAGALNPGSARDRVENTIQTCRNWANTHYPVFVEDGQVFQVKSQDVAFANNKIQTQYPQYVSKINDLAYQTSDIGRIEWRMNTNSPLSAAVDCRKPWSREEVELLISGLPGYNSGHVDNLWFPYKMCCTILAWPGLMLAYKAMGIEKLLDNELQARMVATYLQRQRFGPLAHANGGYIDSNQGLTVVNGAGNGYTNVGDLGTEFSRKLYESWVRNSMRGPSGAGTILASLPVSGVESLGLGTVSSIYIDVSTPFMAGSSVTVYCRGLNGFSTSDFMTLFVGDESQITENYVELLGIKLLLGGNITSFPFTLPVGGNIASLTIPLLPSLSGTFLLQAILVRVVSGQLQVIATNALRARII